MRKGLIWLVFLSISAGCSDAGRQDDRPDADAPAQSAPAGAAALPLAYLDDDTAPPGVLAHAFSDLGVEGVRVDLIEADDDALLLVRIALDSFEPALIGGRPGGVSAAGALEEAQIVVGSGFVSHVSSLTPVGLLQIDGEILSDMQPYGYTRVLGVRSAAIGVLGHREFHRGMYHSAMQLGPGIVEQGRLDISEQDLQRPRYLRAFVATCGRTTIAGVSLRPVHLHTLGKRLLAFFERAGLVCGEVVNLAGDREAVLAMAAPDGKRFAYFGHPKTAKAALVGFKRRD